MGHRGENETSCDGKRSNHFCGHQNLHQQQVTTNPASKIAEREAKAVMLGANPGHTLFIDLDMEKTRDELWYQYQAEVATLERFGQRNVISFDEWLDIKGYGKNETRANI